MVGKDVAAMGRVALSNRVRAIIIQPMDLVSSESPSEIFETILPEEMPSVAEHIGDWRPRTILHVGATAMNPHESRSNSVSDRLGHCCTETCGALIALISSPAGD